MSALIKKMFVLSQFFISEQFEMSQQKRCLECLSKKDVRHVSSNVSSTIVYNIGIDKKGCLACLKFVLSEQFEMSLLIHQNDHIATDLKCLHECNSFLP